MNTLSLQQHDNDPQEQQQQQDRIDVIDHSDHQSNSSSSSSSSSDDELITTMDNNNNNNNNNNNYRSITHMFTRLLKHSSRRIIGVALIASVVIIWVGSSEAIQFVFRDLSFDKPLFLTYYNTSLFSLYLIGFLFVPRWRRSLVYCCTRRTRRRRRDPFHNHINHHHSNHHHPNNNNNNNNNSEHYYYDIPYTLMTSLLMCPLWFLANVTFNYSLSKTSVASNTVISNTSSLFTFVLCLLLRIDQFSFMRFVAIGFSIGGVALVTVYDSHNNNNNNNSSSSSNDNRMTMIGNLLTLFSAFMYGTYTTLLKIRSPEIHDNNNNNNNNSINSINNDNRNNASISPVVDDGVVPTDVVDVVDDEKNNNNNKRSVSMPMVFGFMGLFNILMLWPLFFIVHGLNIEKFSWFPSKKVFVAITLNGLIGTMLSDLLWAFSVVFTSPIVSTIGLALTIPLAFTSDVFIHQTKSFSAAYLLGSSLIICSFVMVNISYQLPAKIRAYDSPSFQWLINRLPSEWQQVLLLSNNSSLTQPSTAAYATLLDSMDSSSNSATTETPQSVDEERI